jgi:TRAP-type mannitol/chloroaromatic compound transport system permease small subunit
MLYGTIFMAGAAWTLLKDEHVRIEVLYERVSPRTRAFIDVMGYAVFFFPSMIALFYYGADFAIKSWKLMESSGESMWGPPIYPFKTVMPVAVLLLILQGIAQFLRSLISLFERNQKVDNEP